MTTTSFFASKGTNTNDFPIFNRVNMTSFWDIKVRSSMHVEFTLNHIRAIMTATRYIRHRNKWRMIEVHPFTEILWLFFDNLFHYDHNVSFINLTASLGLI